MRITFRNKSGSLNDHRAYHYKQVYCDGKKVNKEKYASQTSSVLLEKGWRFYAKYQVKAIYFQRPLIDFGGSIWQDLKELRKLKKCWRNLRIENDKLSGDFNVINIYGERWEFWVHWEDDDGAYNEDLCYPAKVALPIIRKILERKKYEDIKRKVQ